LVAADREGLPRTDDFVMIVALDPPDFRTISDFRKRHLKALGALFLQVLKLCETAGQTGPRRAGWHEDQGERVETQSDEL
jgi:hypothetical protein